MGVRERGRMKREEALYVGVSVSYRRLTVGGGKMTGKV